MGGQVAREKEDRAEGRAGVASTALGTGFKVGCNVYAQAV